MRAIFVAGTDTGVGKTIIAGAIAAVCADEGMKVAVMKPVACGSDEDALFLKRCAASSQELSDIMPIYYKEPLAPQVAATRSRHAFDLKKILAAHRRILDGRPDILIVEGCGGLLVPLSRRLSVVDLIPELKAKVLLVSRSGLGAINHSLLSLEALRARKIVPLGVLFNRLAGGRWSVPEETNPAAVEQLGHTSNLGVFPHIKLDCSSHCLAQAARKHIDLKKILC